MFPISSQLIWSQDKRNASNGTGLFVWLVFWQFKIQLTSYISQLSSNWFPCLPAFGPSPLCSFHVSPGSQVKSLTTTQEAGCDDRLLALSLSSKGIFWFHVHFLTSLDKDFWLLSNLCLCQHFYVVSLHWEKHSDSRWRNRNCFTRKQLNYTSRCDNWLDRSSFEAKICRIHLLLSCDLKETWICSI